MLYQEFRLKFFLLPSIPIEFSILARKIITIHCYWNGFNFFLFIILETGLLMFFMLFSLLSRKFIFYNMVVKG